MEAKIKEIKNNKVRLEIEDQLTFWVEYKLSCVGKSRIARNDTVQFGFVPNNHFAVEIVRVN